MNLLLANIHWDHGVDANPERMKHLHFPIGLAIIGGEILKKRNDSIFVVDNYIEKLSDEKVFAFIENNKINCVLLSMFLGNYQYGYLKKFITTLTSVNSSVKVIVGGPLASAASKIFLENQFSDNRLIMVIGEGEETVVELLECIEQGGDLKKVKGIAYQDKGDVFTPLRERIKNLDKYAHPAYSLFETKKYVEYVKRTDRCWEISSSRGCFGRCVYCKLVFGEQITMRTPVSIVKEMEDFYHNYGVNKFNFVDDNFLNSEWQVREFYKALRTSDIKFKWRFQGRADRLNLELLHLLIDVGLYDISFGIESGSPGILKDMNKNMDLALAGNNLRLLPDEIDTHGNFIVGMPGESPDTINETIRFVEDTGLKHANACILNLFPGTKIYDYAREKCLIVNENDYCENLGPVYVKPYINLTKYDDRQLMSWVERINSSGTLNKEAA